MLLDTIGSLMLLLAVFSIAPVANVRLFKKLVFDVPKGKLVIVPAPPVRELTV